jgi:hypothetical protein
MSNTITWSSQHVEMVLPKVMLASSSTCICTMPRSGSIWDLAGANGPMIHPELDQR